MHRTPKRVKLDQLSKLLVGTGNFQPEISIQPEFPVLADSKKEDQALTNTTGISGSNLNRNFRSRSCTPTARFWRGYKYPSFFLKKVSSSRIEIPPLLSSPQARDLLLPPPK